MEEEDEEAPPSKWPIKEFPQEKVENGRQFVTVSPFPQVTTVRGPRPGKNPPPP